MLHLCRRPVAGTYPPLPAHIHGLRENGEWCICIQILKNGPATWPYTSSKTGRPSAPPPRSSAYPNPPYMQTQQKGTVPLVDSVKEIQQSSESPPKPLAFARKSEISLMEKSQNRSVRSVSPAGQASKGFPLSFAPNIPKLIPFPVISFSFDFICAFHPFI